MWGFFRWVAVSSPSSLACCCPTGSQTREVVAIPSPSRELVYATELTTEAPLFVLHWLVTAAWWPPDGGKPEVIDFAPSAQPHGRTGGPALMADIQSAHWSEAYASLDHANGLQE